MTAFVKQTKNCFNTPLNFNPSKKKIWWEDSSRERRQKIPFLENWKWWKGSRWKKWKLVTYARQRCHSMWGLKCFQGTQRKFLTWSCRGLILLLLNMRSSHSKFLYRKKRKIHEMGSNIFCIKTDTHIKGKLKEI